MPTVTVDSIPLAYEDRGQGLPVLLLHAFPLSGQLFQPQLDALSPKYRLIVPDLRGFGRSGLGEGPTEMARFAEDALALLDALGIQAAVVGGVSMGGYAAMAVARQDPGRVKGLVLMDTQAGPDDEAARQHREATARSVLRDGMGVMVDTMLPRLLADTASPQVRARVEAMIRSNRPEGTAAAARGMALRPDSREILARFGGPALVLVGDKDAVTPPDKARAMAERIAGARLEIAPGAGHLANLEAPDAVNRALDAFLATVPA